MKYLAFMLLFVSSLVSAESIVWDYQTNTVSVLYRVTSCGQTKGVYTVTALTGAIKVNQNTIDIGSLMLPQGTWFCTQKAAGPNNAWSIPSNEVSFIVGLPPAAPTNLRVVP